MLQLKKAIRLENLRLPFKQALVTAAQIGADGVEINGRTEIRPSDMSRTAIRHLKKMLADLNLSVSAIHFPTRRGYGVTDDLDRRIDATKEAMKLAFELGCSTVVNRIGTIPTDTHDSSWTTLVQALTDLGNYSQKSGAWLAARTGSEDGETMKRLIDHLPAHSLQIDFDPADFVIHGFSPTESMKQLGEHVAGLRARDAVTDISRGQGVEVQLGRGSVDWSALLGMLEEKNFNGFLTVQRDTDNNPAQQCAQAFGYLTNLFE